MIHPGEAQRHIERYENELAGTEACKDFILTQVDPVYFNAIRRPRIVFKGITLLQFLGHPATSVWATSEEKAQGKAKLLEPWDPPTNTEFNSNASLPNADHLLTRIESVNLNFIHRYETEQIIHGNSMYVPLLIFVFGLRTCIYQYFPSFPFFLPLCTCRFIRMCISYYYTCSN